MKPWQVQLIAAIASVLVGSGLFAAYNHYQREIGKRDLLIAQYTQAAQQAQRRADSLAKVYRTDTLRLWRVVRTTDTLTQTVERWKHDTLKVVEYVAKADTAIKACTLALQTCEQRVAAERDGRIAAEQKATTLEHLMPSKFSPVRHRIEGAVVCIAVTAIVSALRGH